VFVFRLEVILSVFVCIMYVVGPVVFESHVASHSSFKMEN